MKSLSPLLVLLALVVTAPADARKQDSELDLAVRQAGEDYLKAENGVGLSIGVVRDGRFYCYAFGKAAKDGGPTTRDTAFEIGSISKTMSGLLLARAVVVGKARLDDDVRLYLQGSYPKLAFEGEPVRLVHLANMTSGLPDDLPDLSALDPDPGRFKRARALAAYGKERFLADLRNVSPTRKPGADVGHSNMAAQLLTYALERIYGIPYDALLRREIEASIGSTTTQHSTGYGADGEAAATLPRAHFGYRYSIPGMLRYAAHQLDERDPAVALSHKGAWYTLDRKTWVGLTWIVSELPDGGRMLRYSGGTWGFASAMMLWPERKLGIVLLANKASNTAQDRLGKIAQGIALLPPAKWPAQATAFERCQ